MSVGRDLLLVGVLACTLRLALAVAVRDATLFADMVEYHERAQILLRDGQLNFDSWRVPGYPLFLAALYALPGDDLAAARIANAVLAGVSAVLTGVLAARFVSRRAAAVAAVIVAAYPASVLSAVFVMPEGLYGCLVLGALVLSARSAPSRSILAGLTVGYATLTRSLGAALLPAIIGGNFLAGRLRRNRQGAAAEGLLLLAVFALTVSPWFIHTTSRSGGLMLDSSSAANMLAGNNPRATGRLEIPVGHWIFDTYLAGTANEAERNRRAIRYSVEWIASHPIAWLRLVPIKIGYLWGLEGREYVWLYSHSYFGPRSGATVWTWAVLLLVSFPLLAVPAAVGLWRPGLAHEASGWHLLLLLALVTGLHVLSFGESRFHLPLVPVLAVLAVRAFDGGEPFTRTRAAWCAATIAALCVAWATQAPELVHPLLRLVQPDGWQSGLEY
jgi:4-amino-4-deoxy-L-arabinose transferase-like glycosyltransferase